MMRPSFRSALTAERPLVTPLAHDALSARLIERAGFRAFAIGGSALLAMRYGLPDIGLVGLSDMVAGAQIADASMLPFLVDGDDGYGDTKNVARMIQAAVFEAAGTPWLSPASLGDMGFTHVSFPSTLILRLVATLRSALDELRACRRNRPHAANQGGGQAQAVLDEALDVDNWLAIASGDDKGEKSPSETRG